MIPLSQTIFLWQSMLLAAILVAVSVAIAYFSCPRDEEARTAEEMGIRFEPLVIEREEARTPAEKLEQSPILTLAVAALMVAWLVRQIASKGAIAALDLNTFNFTFITAGLILHWRPRSFLRAVSRSVPATAGVLIQFPFYAGIFGIISNTAIETRLAEVFVHLTTKGTFPLVVAGYSALLGLFIPSGGGKWIVEAPYVMGAANAWNVHLGWTVQIYNAAEALPNLINPFWMLPLMGILNAKARDLAGYSILQLVFHVPIVLLSLLAVCVDVAVPAAGGAVNGFGAVDARIEIGSRSAAHRRGATGFAVLHPFRVRFSLSVLSGRRASRDTRLPSETPPASFAIPRTRDPRTKTRERRTKNGDRWTSRRAGPYLTSGISVPQK